MEIIHGELIAKDLQFLVKKIDDVDKVVKRTNVKSARDEMEVLLKVQECLNKKLFIKDADWKSNEVETINQYSLLTAKPIVYLVNISIEDYKKKKNKWLPKIN
jgi:obg-like ATPase 1